MFNLQCERTVRQGRLMKPFGKFAGSSRSSVSQGVLLVLAASALFVAGVPAAWAVPPTPPGGWPPLPAGPATPVAPFTSGAHVAVTVAQPNVANPGQALSLIATIANTGDEALTSPQISPVSGRCVSGDVLLSGLYELVGDGDAAFEPGEIRARFCRGYAPLAYGSYAESFQGSAIGVGGTVSRTSTSNLDVVAFPATPTAPAGGWPAPPPAPPAPTTTAGLSFDIKAFGPASVVAGDPVTVLGTIANTGTGNLFLLEFTSVSGPCADSMLTAKSGLYEIHGDGDGVSVLEPGEMFGATCSGYAQASYAQGGTLRGRVAPAGGGTLEDSDTLSIPVLPSPAADMTVSIDGPLSVTPGHSLTLTAVIENTGSVPLTLASVVPDGPCPWIAQPISTGGGVPSGGVSFEPGETIEVACTFTPDGSVDPIVAGVTVIGDIGAAYGGGSLTRTATKSVDVNVDSRIKIVTIDPPTTGPAGQPVTTTAELTNPGNTALTVQSIVTTPTQCPPAPRQIISGDSDALLEPGEIWRFTCTVNAPSTSDPITASATVHALDPALTPVQDSFSFPFDPLTNGTGGTSVDFLPEQSVGPGVTVGTNTTTSPGDPIGTQVISPYGTTISIIETTVLTTQPAPSAGFLGWQVDIRLHPNTPGSSATNPLPPENPLRVIFYIDQSIFGNGGQIYRDGIAIPAPQNCLASGIANPEPCIESRVPTANGVKLTVLAVHASSWNFVGNGAPEVPVVTITRPAAGVSYLLGQAVNADFKCIAEQLLTPGCVGDVPNGAAIPTGAAALGPRLFAVTAKVLGGERTLTHNYSVLFGGQGFTAPVDNRPVVNGAKAGSAIPVKFQLRDASGASAHPLVGLDVLAGTPTSARVNCSSGTVDDIEYTDIAQTGELLTYDPVAARYQFVWKTAKTWSSTSSGPCRRLTVPLRDGTTRTADFRFK